MDYEKRLLTLKSLLDTLRKKVQQDTSAAKNNKFQESQIYLQQIETEIDRIGKMRSYKK